MTAITLLKRHGRLYRAAVAVVVRMSRQLCVMMVTLR